MNEDQDRGIIINLPARQSKLVTILENIHNTHIEPDQKIMVIGAADHNDKTMVIGKQALINHMMRERGMDIIDVAMQETKKTEFQIKNYALHSGIITQLNGKLDRSMFTKPIIRETPKISRNSACSCNSGKKYKRCCGNI